MQFIHYVWLWTSIIYLSMNYTNASLCPNDCQDHGDCGNDEICRCHKPWTGPDCSLLECPRGYAWDQGFTGIDTAHDLMECSNRGLCDRTMGLCQCDNGFTGPACERLTCNCNGHGRCLSMKDYARTKDPGFGLFYNYDQNWDRNSIFGCLCDDEYTGYDCSKRICPHGDDPLTPDPSLYLQTNDQQIVTCTAVDGWFTISFRGYMTKPIYANDTIERFQSKLEALPSIHGVEIIYGPLSSIACSPIGNEISIEFLQDFGNLPLLVGNADALVSNGISSTSLLSIVKSRVGTKENIPCSGRGTCDHDLGICTCYQDKYRSSDGYGKLGLRGDCGHAVTTITSCPGELTNICSGHGLCAGSPTFQCQCYNGWQGGDCSEQSCPFGKAWFDLPVGDNEAHRMAECSNMGICDRTKGQCICRLGFSGDACDRMDCPNACNGHGRCKTINELAEEFTMNGDPALYSYGNVVNNDQTWDYDMIQGCQCDATWFGYDCSLRKCPSGDDVITTTNADGSLQMLETQVLLCTGTQGTFTLTFRKATTVDLQFNAKANEVKSAIEVLDTVGSVNVEYSTGESFCTTNGSNQVQITFLDDFGSLPPLTSSFQGITSIAIISDGTPPSIKGSKEDAVCSNRGICQETTGLCKCFEGFASSDGNGQPGLRGDCGYHRPFISISEVEENDEL